MKFKALNRWLDAMQCNGNKQLSTCISGLQHAWKDWRTSLSDWISVPLPSIHELGWVDPPARKCIFSGHWQIYSSANLSSVFKTNHGTMMALINWKLFRGDSWILKPLVLPLFLKLVLSIDSQSERLFPLNTPQIWECRMEEINNMELIRSVSHFELSSESVQICEPIFLEHP